MKDYKEKNAFTLVELLVAISIMSIILVIAIPSIGAIQKRNANKRYKNYGETLVSSGKLYTDSNNIDMFGYEQDGCFDIQFEKLLEKNLVKDIDYKDVTCADGSQKRTFIRVKKLDGQYKYQLSMYCVDGKGNMTYSDLMKDKEPICAGEKSYLGPEIVVSPDKTNGYLSENETYKVSITVKDDDGLLENNEVDYAWCKNSDCSDVSSYTKISFKNKRDVNKASEKIKRPKGDGVYYLKVRPTKVIDVFNNVTSSEAKIYGPYKFDTTPPVVTVIAYRRSANGGKEGNLVGQATLGSKQLLADKKYRITGSMGSNYTNNYAGWLNKTNFPNGIYYEINYSDNIEVETETWKENKTGHNSATAAAKVLDGRTDNKNLKSKSGTVIEYFKDDGYRKGQIVVTDVGGNYVTVDLEAYLDLTLPTKPGISNPSNGNWTNKDFSLVLTSADSMSGIKKYQYAYTNKVWYDYANSNNTKFTTPLFNQERNENAYIRSMDAAGNYSPENSTPIKIDKTKPTCKVTDNTTVSGGRQDGLEYRVTCSDNLSGIKTCDGKVSTISDYVNQKSGKTFQVVDNTGNVGSCGVEIKKQYSVRTCNTCGRCKGAGCQKYKSCAHADCGTKSCNCTSKCVRWGCYSTAGALQYETSYDCSAKCSFAIVKCTKTKQSCGTCNKTCETSACGCKTYKESCPTCGCSKWNGYGDWSDSNTCGSTKENNNKCEKKVRWVISRAY